MNIPIKKSIYLVVIMGIIFADCCASGKPETIYGPHLPSGHNSQGTGNQSGGHGQRCMAGMSSSEWQSHNMAPTPGMFQLMVEHQSQISQQQGCPVQAPGYSTLPGGYYQSSETNSFQRGEQEVSLMNQQLLSLSSKITLLCADMEQLEANNKLMKKELEGMRNQNSPVFNINNSGGMATANSNPAITTTQEVKQEGLDDYYGMFRDTFMTPQTAFILTLLLAGLMQQGPQGGAIVVLFCGGVSLASHFVSAKFKRKVKIGFYGTGTAALAGIVAVTTRDKELASFAVAVCPISLGITALLLASE